MRTHRFKRRLSRAQRRLKRLLGLAPKPGPDYSSDWQGAKCFVGTDETSGELQFELLKKLGCVPSSKVLEVGCGALHASIPIMRYLEAGHFVGVDPTEWPREETLERAEIRQLVADKNARFLTREDFDASELGITFDFVLSHSVLSHAAHAQLGQYLEKTSAILAPEGRILASLRLAEGNPYGNRGSRDGEDTRAKEWRYPGGVWFKLQTIKEVAEQLGLRAVYRPDFTEFYTTTRPRESHDWIEFSFSNAAVKEPEPSAPPHQDPIR